MSEPIRRTVWDELGDRIYRRRYESLDLNVGLVVDGDEVLVIDSRASHHQADVLIEEIRQVTPHPVTVLVNTHHHWDHTFGNARFTDGTIIGHDRCRSRLADDGEAARAGVLDMDGLGAAGQRQIEAVVITPPDTTFSDRLTVPVGDRTVELRHHGRGHTDNDIVVEIDDVLFAGDLVEEGAAPWFGDGYPTEWVATLDRMLEDVRGPVLPGHGDVVDRDFVREQRDLIARAVAGEPVFPDPTMRDIERRLASH